jgi:thioredoxin-related protein
MAKNICFVVLVFSLLSFDAAKSTEIAWLPVSEGFQKASQTQKIAFIDAYTSWCGFCKKMDSTTFADPEVVARIEQHFIPIKFNPERTETYFIEGDTLTGNQLLKKLNRGRYKGYPSYFFYFPEKGKTIHISGYMGKASFLRAIDQVLSVHRDF